MRENGDSSTPTVTNLAPPEFDNVAGTKWVLLQHPDRGRGLFSEGLAGVKVGEKWGYIDKKGLLSIKARVR